MNNREIRPEKVRSARARAMARRRKRQLKRRLVLSGMGIGVLLLVVGAFWGISQYRVTKEKRKIITQAVEAIEKADYLEAIRLVDEAIEKANGKVGKLEESALLYRAEAEYNLQDYDAAIHTYTILEQEADNKKVVPLKANMYNQKAAAEIKAGDSDNALVTIEEGIALAGEDGKLIQNLEFNRAVAYEHKQEFDEALKLFEAYAEKYGYDEAVDHEIAFLKSRSVNGGAN